MFRKSQENTLKKNQIYKILPFLDPRELKLQINQINSGELMPSAEERQDTAEEEAEARRNQGECQGILKGQV